MVVYMLLNEGSELAYVGKTEGDLTARWQAHVEDALVHGSVLPIHRAIREWGTDVWMRVVLEECSSEGELAEAEKRWIEYCGTMDPHVGYNVVRGPGALDRALQWYARERLKQYHSSKEFAEECGRRGARHREEMSAEEIEQYREWGRKGAKPRSEMTHEERQRYVEWGKRGARKAMGL